MELKLLKEDDKSTESISRIKIDKFLTVNKSFSLLSRFVFLHCKIIESISVKEILMSMLQYSLSRSFSLTLAHFGKESGKIVDQAMILTTRI